MEPSLIQSTHSEIFPEHFFALRVVFLAVQLAVRFRLIFCGLQSVLALAFRFLERVECNPYEVGLIQVVSLLDLSFVGVRN